MLEVRHLSTGYGKKQVLYDVSFSIAAGEIVLLIGSNGSGKSTLLKAIYGLLPPFAGGAGEIIFNGEDITRCPPAQLIRKGLVYIPQKNNCFDNLTVKENLEVSALSLPDASVRRQAYAQALDSMPLLQAHLTKYPYQLSGGERQLLAFSMALTHSPKLLLLDECFAGFFQNQSICRAQIDQIAVMGDDRSDA